MSDTDERELNRKPPTIREEPAHPIPAIKDPHLPGDPERPGDVNDPAEEENETTGDGMPADRGDQ